MLRRGTASFLDRIPEVLMTIRDILRTKGQDVVTIAPDEPVPDAMRLLCRHNIGALVVVAGPAIAGIVTERDMLRAGAEDLGRLGRAQVRDIMTTVVITAEPEQDIRTVMDTMTQSRIRHLPVVSDGTLCGMISIGDVINALRRSTETENQQLHAYIAGTPL
jgi:CBS domain-containing protein